MAGKPNFTGVRIDGSDVIVDGASPEDAKDKDTGVVDLLGVAVFLSQGEHTAVGAAKPDEAWVATLEGEANNFSKGQASVTGVEVRKENSTITTWSQKVQIT
ncbi:MAG TPA: hypothetical protein VGF25_23985 [Thermoleophilaceae bacterium]|jgi:hypothetical protein